MPLRIFGKSLLLLQSTNLNLVYQFACKNERKGNKNAIPIHVLVERLNDSVIAILPAVHAGTGITIE